MQVNDIQVLRLDYTREPTGYMVGAGGDFQSEGYVWWTGVVLPPDSASDDETAEPGADEAPHTIEIDSVPPAAWRPRHALAWCVGKLLPGPAGWVVREVTL